MKNIMGWRSQIDGMDKNMTRCLYCDKKIYKSTARQKFCNRSCYMKYRRENPEKGETLCWRCKNTNGNICSWFSEDMRPVEGWTAEEKPTVDGMSYFVISCPKYERLNRKERKEK